MIAKRMHKRGNKLRLSKFKDMLIRTSWDVLYEENNADLANESFFPLGSRIALKGTEPSQ